MTVQYRSVGHGEIIVEHTGQDSSFASDTLAYIREAVQDLASYFELSEPFPAIRAVIAPHRREFDRCVKDILKVEIETPSHPARTGMPQGTDLILLSPRAYEKRHVQYPPDAYRRLVFHEVTHIVEEYLSPDIEAIPRWWSEGLAVYLSGQSKHEQKDKAAVLAGIEQGNISQIAEMEGDTAFTSDPVRLCYEWGWTIVMFVEHVYGKAAVRRIVKECGDGHPYRLVGQDLNSFGQQWQGWLLRDGKRS